LRAILAANQIISICSSISIKARSGARKLMKKKLPGALIEQIADALASSFSRDEFERLVRVACSESLTNITMAPNYMSQIYDTIDWAKRRDQLLTLLNEALEQRANSKEIRSAIDGYQNWIDTDSTERYPHPTDNQPASTSATTQNPPPNPTSWDTIWTMLVSATVIGSLAIIFHNSSGCFTPFCQTEGKAEQWERIAMSYWGLLGISLALAAAGAICYYYVANKHWAGRTNEIPFPRLNRIEDSSRDPLLSKLILGVVVIVTAFAFYSSSYKYSKSRVGTCEAGEIVSYGSGFFSSRYEAIGKPKSPLSRTHMSAEMDCKADELSQEYIWYLTDVIILILLLLAVVYWILWFRLTRVANRKTGRRAVWRSAISWKKSNSVRLPTIELAPVWVKRAGFTLCGLAIVLPLMVMFSRAAYPPRDSAAQLRPEMVVLPAGSYLMGSPEDEQHRDDDERQHRVELTRPFAISRTEVTQAHYGSVTGTLVDDDCDGDGIAVGLGDTLPVVCVSWFDAVSYVNALSRLEGLDPAYVVEGSQIRWNKESDGYRLPTEAEWEYAARSGRSTIYVGTSNEGDVCQFANVADRTLKAEFADEVGGQELFDCDDSYPLLSPVESRAFNSWWLFGFGGNALEWVWDWHEPFDSEDQIDPSGPKDGGNRVLRGGSFGGDPRSARVANRGRSVPGGRYADVGFRIARSCPFALLSSDTLPASQCFDSKIAN